MTTSQLVLQTGITFVAASLGAFLAASLARQTEQFKHLQQLRSIAYADFLRGFARVGRAQSDRGDETRSKQEELEGRVVVTDSRSRIAIYGSSDVLRSMAKFIRLGTQTMTPEGREAFAKMCALMRQEAVEEDLLLEDIKAVLFG